MKIITGAVWFTSDQHFDHQNVIKYCNRPFKDITHMNEELVRRHNELVGPNDIVYHLGDFSLNKRAPGNFLPRLNGEHHLIAGNHDWCHPVQAKKKQEQMTQLYLDAGFKTIQLQDSAVLMGIPALMHHMPYVTLEEQEREEAAGRKIRYLDYRPEDTGQWLLHGHVHEAWKVKGRCINVGVDQWSFAPVSLAEIAEIIRG